MKTILVNNPAIDTFLSRFRSKDTDTFVCNQCVETMSFFLAGEASRYLSTSLKVVRTPLGDTNSLVIDEEVILIPILRAGVSMLSGFQRILPKSRTGFIWAHRNKEAIAELDTYKFPGNVEGKTVILLDTMLATGGTIQLACDTLSNYRPKQILCASILATPRGIEKVKNSLTAVFAVGLSDSLDGNLYVYPGVGDSGDRLYG